MKKSEKFIYLVCSENDNKSNDLLSVFDNYEQAFKNVKYEFYGEKIPRDQKEFKEKVTVKEDGDETLFKMNKALFMKIIKVKLNDFSIYTKSVIAENLKLNKNKKIKKKETNHESKETEFDKFKKEILDKFKEFENKFLPKSPK